MHINYRNLTIRNAEKKDAEILVNWWNDGRIMEHAGYPNGLSTNIKSVSDSLLTDDDFSQRRLIIEADETPVGEMNYRNKGNSTAEIGIKICDKSYQERGLGRLFLSMIITSLFDEYGYKKIILDTNIMNARAQHIYELLGFAKIRTNYNSWKNQLGEMQSSVEYELYQKDFNSFLSEQK